MRLLKTPLGILAVLGVTALLAAPLPAQESESQSGGSETESVSQRGRRDPFEALVRRSQGGRGQDQIPDRLPAGKAGLQVSTMRLSGLVQSASGAIAVVSNPQNRVYFLHEGDRLYDGTVERITLDGMVLRERGRDAFGKPVERLVTKRLYASAGD